MNTYQIYLAGHTRVKDVDAKNVEAAKAIVKKRDAALWASMGYPHIEVRS